MTSKNTPDGNGQMATGRRSSLPVAAQTRARVGEHINRDYKQQSTVLIYALLLVGIAVACLCSLLFGSRTVSFDTVLQALSPEASGIAVEAVRLRIPRTVLAIIVGMALAVAGTIMQGVARNPLADPSILGLNTGAAFAIVCAIATFGLATPIQYVWVALLGSACTACAVWFIGSLGHSGPTPLKLTLAGAVLSSVLASLTSAILLPRVNIIATYRFWQVGGLSGARFSLIAPILPILVLGFILAWLSAPALNMLALGDELAAGLGLQASRARMFAWGSAVLLCAGATSLAGPIGFVGLVVPHAARLLVGGDYRRIMAISACIGPLLLLWADVIGRILTRPADVEVGIVTALIGAPIFVVLVRRRKIGEV